MRQIPPPFKYVAVALAFALCSVSLVSCDDDEQSNWEKYSSWRKFNDQWLAEQADMTNPDGTPFYTKCEMPSDPETYVLMHRIGLENTANYTPLYTSTTKVNYTLSLANDSVVDKGTGFTTQLNSSSLIQGWSLAVMQLHEGDSATFIIPYQFGYGDTGSGKKIKPYSNLRFNIRLVEIVGYEIRP